MVFAFALRKPMTRTQQTDIHGARKSRPELFEDSSMEQTPVMERISRNPRRSPAFYITRLSAQARLPQESELTRN